MNKQKKDKCIWEYFTPLVPAKRASYDKHLILSGFMPSDNMDWSTIAQHKYPIPPEAPSKKQGSGNHSLLTPEHSNDLSLEA